MLRELFDRYGTNKGELGYTPYYEQCLEKSRFHVRRVLEVGIYNMGGTTGASLFAWRDYFPNAEIFGIDNDHKFIFNDQWRIRTDLCDAYLPDVLHDTLIGFGGRPFDLIIDDAVHDPGPQVQLANQLVNWLIPGGLYFMEDVCPYKMPNGSVDHGIFDHLRGFDSVVACGTAKPECLIVGMR